MPSYPDFSDRVKLVFKSSFEDFLSILKKHHLWLISDEVYESFVYDDLSYYSIAVKTDIFDQTITVFSFAKMFMVAGYRLGYEGANKILLETINKVSVHLIYISSSLVQYMTIEPVKNRRQWLPTICDHYIYLRDLAIHQLQVEAEKPQSGYFYFFNLEPFSVLVQIMICLWKF